MKAVDWDEKYRSSAGSLWSFTPNLFVEDRLASRLPGAAVDLACGEGRNAVWLAEQGWSVTAVDFSPVAVERGRQRSEDVEFVVADILAWEPEGPVDLVLVAYLHIVEDEFRSLLTRANRWLSEDGEVFLIGHDRSNIEDGYGGPQVPEILWNVETIVGWLDGMEIVEAQVVRRPVEEDGETHIARDALIRARARLDQREPS
ncbi:MAG: class I SAM-dependent methyltransferase [Acidimicrobiia bacterium]|nr:class I SAM-dependent methyltransferase [Acidimicrobiia bacterium]